jgi:di/tricarboxylate transporter
MDAAIVLGVVVTALVLFWTEWVPIEITSILVVFLLAVTGVLSPADAFAGLANDTVVFIFALLAMTQGLVATGVMRIVAERLTFVGRFGARAFLVGTMVVVAVFSAFVSNTVTTAAFLPIVMSAATRVGVPVRDALLPMAFASMLGGTILLFGTSTNLVMTAAMQRSGLAPLGVTELAPAGLPITVLGVVLIAWLAPRLLRRGEEAPAEEGLPERAYLAELAVPAGSPHVGRAVADVAQVLGARPVGVVRKEGTAARGAEEKVAPEDRVVLEGGRDEIVAATEARGVDVPAAEAAGAAREADGGAREAAGGREEGAGLVVVEAAVPPGSRLAGRSVEEARLSHQLGIELLALHRRPAVQRITRLQLLGRLRAAPSIHALPLSVGDVLLLRAPAERVRDLASSGSLLVLTGVPHDPPRRGKAALAVALFGAALALGSTGVLPLSVAGLGGVVAMVLTGCVDGRRALRVEWRVVLLIAAMLALGLAMERSGAGALVGEGVARLGSAGGPRGVLVALALLTILLSAPMSNQAAALVVFPIALSAAAHLHVDPRPFAIAVTLAGSCSFMTPLEPAAMLVYGAGRYRFKDFTRVGTPLTLALLVVIALLVPVFWPFERAARGADQRRAAAETSVTSPGPDGTAVGGRAAASAAPAGGRPGP